MSDKVKVPFNGESNDRAVLLLAAAEELDLDASVVGVTAGAFVVPQEVADKAGLSESDSGDAPEENKPAAKKATAKKTAAKKTASKKE